MHLLTLERLLVVTRDTDRWDSYNYEPEELHVANHRVMAHVCCSRAMLYSHIRLFAHMQYAFCVMHYSGLVLACAVQHSIQCVPDHRLQQVARHSPDLQYANSKQTSSMCLCVGRHMQNVIHSVVQDYQQKRHTYVLTPRGARVRPCSRQKSVAKDACYTTQDVQGPQP